MHLDRSTYYYRCQNWTRIRSSEGWENDKEIEIKLIITDSYLTGIPLGSILKLTVVYRDSNGRIIHGQTNGNTVLFRPHRYIRRESYDTTRVIVDSIWLTLKEETTIVH